MDDNNMLCGEADCDSDSNLNHKNVTIRCGTGGGLILPLRGSDCGCGSNSSGQTPALVVGLTNLDTLGMDEPTIKIDFSSLINFRATSVGGRYFLGIIFQLSKICNNSFKTPLATWIFEKKVDNFQDNVACCCDPNGVKPNPEIATNSESFTSSWCECHSCPGCCTYILEIIDFDSAFIDFASISNISITAMAI